MTTTNNTKNWLKFFFLSCLIIWYGFFLTQKINLITADLGRHLKNGEMVLANEWGILYKNFYSYTFENFSTINHHWASGLFFYLIEKLVGFDGLSIFYILTSLITFLIFFKISKQLAGFVISTIVSIFLIPLIAERTEIRPEIFTYFLSALFFWFLWQYRNQKISVNKLFILPILEIIWVNTHIYFIIGFLIIASFLLEKIVYHQKQGIKELTLILSLTILASFINPFGFKGFLSPFLIFSNYGYKIVENQSVLFLQKYGLSNPNLFLFEVIFFTLITSFIAVFIKNRSAFSIPFFIISLTLSLMAWLMIRSFTLFGLFTLPILAYNIKNSILDFLTTKSYQKKLLISSSFLTLILFILFINFYSERLSLMSSNFGIGLISDVNASAMFFKNQNLKGPILNNYDIGGYLIYHLFPKEKIFVDNRPEAYPASFFKNEYIPFQENKEKFAEIDKKYNFNIIYFYRHDLTPWGQKFLIDRLNDQNWAPIFFDNYVIIFIKRNENNKEIINKFEVPKTMFKIIKT